MISNNPMDQKFFPSLAVSRTNFCSHLISTKSDKYLGQEKGHKSVDRSNWNLRALFVRTKRTTWCRTPCRKPIKNCFQLASACTFGADTLCSSFHYPIPSGPQEFPTRAHNSHRLVLLNAITFAQSTQCPNDAFVSLLSSSSSSRPTRTS